MSSPELWQRYCSRWCAVPALDLALDFSRIDWPEGHLESLRGPAAAWFDAMAALEKGAIANPDEQRMVGHYWLRRPELAPDDTLRAAIVDTVEKVRHFAAAVHAGRITSIAGVTFKNLLVIGIGGSALGPQFVADALGTARDRMRVFFCDNTDPDGIDRVLGQVHAAEGGFGATLAVVISKSGGTKETRNGMLEAEAAWRRHELDFAKHAVAVTGAGSELDKVAQAGGWLATFPMWDWVGGRTSELSAVGLLPAALQGIDVLEMLEGARLMDEATRVADVTRNPALQLAAAWHFEGQGKGLKDMVVLPYKDRLLLFSRYLQQLVMESLGKEKDLAGRTVHQGIAVYGNKGSTDQHAYVQQLRDGIHNFFLTFVTVRREREGDGLAVEPNVTSGDYLHGFWLGTRAALYENGRASVTIEIPEVGPRTVGALIALFERAVGLYAFWVGINAYHQPGVEAGKKAATAVLELQAQLVAAMAARPGEPLGAEAWAAALGRPDEAENVYHVLTHLAANPGRGVTRSGAPDPRGALFHRG